MTCKRLRRYNGRLSAHRAIKASIQQATERALHDSRQAYACACGFWHITPAKTVQRCSRGHEMRNGKCRPCIADRIVKPSVEMGRRGSALPDGWINVRGVARRIDAQAA